MNNEFVKTMQNAGRRIISFLAANPVFPTETRMQFED